MGNTAYHELPLETLYELLAIAIREMLDAIDSNLDAGIAYKAKRRQVEVLLNEIEEKQKNNLGISSNGHASRKKDRTS